MFPKKLFLWPFFLASSSPSTHKSNTTSMPRDRQQSLSNATLTIPQPLLPLSLSPNLNRQLCISHFLFLSQTQPSGLISHLTFTLTNVAHSHNDALDGTLSIKKKEYPLILTWVCNKYNHTKTILGTLHWPRPYNTHRLLSFQLLYPTPIYS